MAMILLGRFLVVWHGVGRECPVFKKQTDDGQFLTGNVLISNHKQVQLQGRGGLRFSNRVGGGAETACV